jgi:hypothetical protein
MKRLFDFVSSLFRAASPAAEQARMIARVQGLS